MNTTIILRFSAKGFQLLFFLIAAKYVELNIFGEFAYGLVIFSLLMGPALSLGAEQLLLRERVDQNPTLTYRFWDSQLLVALILLLPTLMLSFTSSFSLGNISLFWFLFLLRAWEQTLLVTWRAKNQLYKETIASALSRFVSLIMLLVSLDYEVDLSQLLLFQVVPLFYILPILLKNKFWFKKSFPFGNLV
jgi:hypothetical protein